MFRSQPTESLVDPRLLHALRGVALCGLAVVLCLPVARGSHALLGWLPLWLVAMPLLAWALLALRARQSLALPVLPYRRRRARVQAVLRAQRRPRHGGNGGARRHLPQP